VNIFITYYDILTVSIGVDCRKLLCVE